MDFPHLLRQPQGPSKEGSPLLILLHGKGANEEDLFPLAQHLDPRLTVLSLRAPHEMAPGYYRWYERFDTPQGSVFDEAEIAASLDTLIEAVSSARQALCPAHGKIHVLGFSQGAAVALALALRIPQQLDSVISIAGRILPGALEHAAAPANSDHLALLLMHGREDEVVPFSESSQASAHFKARGVAHELRPYTAGHTLSPAMLKDARSFLQARLDAANT